MANEYRVSTFGVEVMHNGNPDARVSGFGVEVMHNGNPEARVSGFGIEVMRSVSETPLAAGSRRRVSLL